MVSLNYDSSKMQKKNKIFTYNRYSLTLSVILYCRKLGLYFKLDLESISYILLVNYEVMSKFMSKSWRRFGDILCSKSTGFFLTSYSR